MDAPSYPQQPPDPYLTQEEQQAQTDKLNALQDKMKGDTASLMSRYGALMQMAGAK